MPKYDGYIYDQCSWGATVAWSDGTHEEVIRNEWGEDYEDWFKNNNIADSYEEYINE